MSLQHIRKPALVVLFLLLALTVLSLAPQSAVPASGGSAIVLKAPAFVSVAQAQDITTMAFPQDEAGMSAYFKSDFPVALADVRSLYRVIETETADYIIGSVPVPDYLERFDVHLYVHREGWFLAYYLSADPVAKIIDWEQYSGGNIPTILGRVLAIAASSAGVPFVKETYYDFRYPNATHLMLIAEDSDNGNSFQINLPGSYAFNARSYSLVSDAYRGAVWKLDGTQVGSNDRGYEISEGNLTAAQLLQDTQHTITVEPDGGWAKAGLALVYRVP